MKRARQFRPQGQPSERERTQETDRRRGSPTERGYNWKWRKARLTHLGRSPLCIGCEALGEIAIATVVDHVEPHKGDSAKFWNSSMWQSSCNWHHDVVKQILEAMFDRGEIRIEDLWLNSDCAIRLSRRMRCDEV